MSIDLGAIFTLAENIITPIINSSGTTLRVDRTSSGRGAGTINPDTAAVTPEPPTVVYPSRPAILSPIGGIASGTTLTDRATDVRIGDYTVALTVDAAELKEQDVLTVLTCRDPRLIGRVLDVITLLDSSAGAVRSVHARPRSLGGPA